MTQTQLEERIQELERRIAQLNKNRRMLLDIIGNIERESRQKQMELEAKNCRLQRVNCRYARTIMARNARILELEEQLRHRDISATR